MHSFHYYTHCWVRLCPVNLIPLTPLVWASDPSVVKCAHELLPDQQFQGLRKGQKMDGGWVDG